MTWENILKREPISIDDRRDLMDVQPRLDKGAIGHIQSLGKGHWWNEPNSDKSIKHYLDSGTASGAAPHQIEVKAKNKTLTEDEWLQHVMDVNSYKDMKSVDDWAADAGSW